MGIFMWLDGEIVKMGVAIGAAVPDAPTTRLRVSRLSVVTAEEPDPPAPWTNPRASLVPGTYNPKTHTIEGHGKVYGTFEDDPDAPTLTQHQGDFTVTANNQVIENREIFGSVNLRSHTGVVIRNCIIYGPPNAPAYWGTLRGPIFSSSSQMNGVLVEDSVLKGRGNFWVCAMRGGNYTLRRVEITNHQDGPSFTSTAGNVTIEGSVLHNGLYSEFSQADVDSGEHPAGGNFYTHCDGIQFHIGKNYVIRGNYIGGVREPWDHHLGHEADINSGDDWYNAALMIKQEVSNSEPNFIDNVLIENNWLWGGASTLNITSPGADSSGPKNYMTPKPAEGDRPARVGVIIRNNIFLRSTWDDKLATRLNRAGNVMSSSGQAYVLRDVDMGVFLNNTHEDGTAVPIRTGGNYP